jgi:hypothetical protein
VIGLEVLEVLKGRFEGNEQDDNYLEVGRRNAFLCSE